VAQWQDFWLSALGASDNGRVRFPETEETGLATHMHIVHACCASSVAARSPLQPSLSPQKRSEESGGGTTRLREREALQPPAVLPFGLLPFRLPLSGDRR
jgi:hypothetical protein